MGTSSVGPLFFGEAVLDHERARLVRLCAHLSGDHGAAEDLAQETLLEAWRVANRLMDATGYAPWLAAIARNVCRRWARRRALDAPSLSGQLDGAALIDVEEAIPDVVDLEIGLERAELAELLDRALGLLPPAVRALLVARYLDEMPVVELAARHGLTEGAVSVRLHRGRLALRRVLTTELRQDAAAYGLVDPAADEWQETRIWCPRCAKCRLVAHVDREPTRGLFVLRCPACYAADGSVLCDTTGIDVSPILGGVQGYKPALTRLMTWFDGSIRRGLRDGRVACPHCGRPASLARFAWPDRPPPGWSQRGVVIRCDACGQHLAQDFNGLVLCLPASQRFWRRHPRLRILPHREVEAAGQPALVTTIESVAESARLEVISARDTFEVFGIHGDPVP